MKKLHSLFIFSILALTMFVGCQMPSNETTPTNTTPTETPTEDPVDDTPTVDADEATYGFVKTVNYTVVANGQSLPGTKTGAELIAIAKEKNLVKDTDYTIDGTTVTLTASGVEKFFGNTDDDNTSSGDNTPTYTVDLINDGYIEVPHFSYKLAIQNSPVNGYKKGDQVEVLITNGNFDVSTGTYGTPEELYLAKVWIWDKDRKSNTNLDIDVTVTNDHKIQFTMPDKNICVHAIFIDMTTRIEKGEGQNCDWKFRIPNKSKNTEHIVLSWDSKDFDNLTYNENYGKYVWDVCDLNDGDVLFITDFCINERGKPGMIVNNELILLIPFVEYYWKL